MSERGEDLPERGAGGEPVPSPAGGAGAAQPAGARLSGRLGARDSPGARRRLPPPDRVRVVVYLDRRALEDLALIVAHRHGAEGPWTRSAVVRRAVAWYLAKEADWLVRQRRAEQLRRRQTEELEALRAIPREERERLHREQLIRLAVAIATDQDTDEAGGRNR
jgi:hypothetical protein